MKKKLFIILILILTLTLIFCLLNIPLIKTTNHFVNLLETEYINYGLSGYKYKKETKNFGSHIFVYPIGRLVIVKVDKSSRYEFIKFILELYYTHNDNVNNIYINKNGTITIDCRY